MAFPTAVNSQITDAITQSGVNVVAAAPTQALATLYLSLGHALALSAANAVTQQQSANVLMKAVTSLGVKRLLEAPGRGLGLDAARVSK